MPKQSGELIPKGMQFEDALRKMLNTPPPPSSKSAKAEKPKKASRKRK